MSSPCFCSYRELTDRMKRQKELKIVAGELQAQRNLMVRVTPHHWQHLSLRSLHRLFVFCREKARRSKWAGSTSGSRSAKSKHIGVPKLKRCSAAHCFLIAALAQRYSPFPLKRIFYQHQRRTIEMFTRARSNAGS